eukprot:1469222-Alexandrium_andersonii.AAC.1
MSLTHWLFGVGMCENWLAFPGIRGHPPNIRMARHGLHACQDHDACFGLHVAEAPMASYLGCVVVL